QGDRERGRGLVVPSARLTGEELRHIRRVLIVRREGSQVPIRLDRREEGEMSVRRGGDETGFHPAAGTLSADGPAMVLVDGDEEGGVLRLEHGAVERVARELHKLTVPAPHTPVDRA